MYLNFPGSREDVTAPVPRRVLAGAILLIVVACWAVYANALGNGFVYDDAAQVLQNRWIRDIRSLPAIFTSEVWGFQGTGLSNYYRPLLHLLYMLAYHLFGLNAGGFHAVNIVFHTGTSVLVFLFTYRLLGRSVAASPLFPAVAAALLFATHPIHTDAVTPVMSVTDLSLAFFAMLSLYLHSRCTDQGKGSCPAAAVAFFLATLSKETALVLPLLLAAYDWTFGTRTDLRALCRRYFPYLVAVIAYLALRLYAIGAFVPVNSHPELSFSQCLLNIFPLFARYLGKLLLPVNLNAKYEFHPVISLLEANMLLSVVVTLLFGALLWLSVRRAKAVFFALLLVVVPLLPTLYIRAIPYPFAERYLYLPSVGFVLLVAALIARYAGEKRRGAAAAALVVVVALYSAGTVVRNAVWKDNYALWSDTAAKSPGDAIAHANLASALRTRGRTAEAAEQYRIAVTLKPDSEIYRSLGTAYADLGLRERAIEEYRRSLRLKPDNGRTYNDLGSIYGEMGMAEQALACFQAAVRLAPEFADARYNLGMAYRDKGMPDRALVEFEAAVRLNPDDPAFRRALAETEELARRTEGRH